MIKFVRNSEESDRRYGPKMEGKSQKRGFWGYFGPGLRSANGCIFLQNGMKKVPLFAQYLSFLHGFNADLHEIARLSCIYSLLTTFSVGPIYLTHTWRFFVS